MTAETPSRQQMGRERQRMAAVRKAFGAAVEKAAKGETVSIEFFGAAVDYIKASMDRLHAQDQRIHDFLKARAVAAHPELKELLPNLNGRLAQSRVALEALCTARDRFRAAGPSGFKAFEGEVAKFMDVYLNVLFKSHHSTTDIQEKLFSVDDWNQVAGVSQDSLQREATLYAEVKRLAPTGADPDTMPSGRPGQPSKAA